MRFTGEVFSAGGGGHAVQVPPEIAGAFERRRTPVVALVNGQEYRSRLMVYGGKTYLGLRLELLRRLGITAGDPVEIELSEDVAVAVPADIAEPAELTDALAANPAARDAYAALPDTDRSEYARWIGAAEPPDRPSRVARLLRRLTPKA